MAEDNDPLLILLQDTFKNVKQHIPVNQADFKAFLDPTTHQHHKDESTDLRELVLLCSRIARERGRWSNRHAAELHKLLLLLKQSGVQDKVEDMELQHVDFALLISRDKHQHDFNVAAAIRSVLGWLCVSVACYVPWVATMAYFLTIYNNSQSDLLYELIENTQANSSTRFSATQIEDACNLCAIFVFGFFVFLLISLTFSLSVALAQAVDGKRNACLNPVAGWIAAFLTIAVLAYNLFGVVAVWNFALWDSRASATSCYGMRSMAVAILIMFLLIPILCYVLSVIRFKTQPANEEDEAGGEVQGGFAVDEHAPPPLLMRGGGRVTHGITRKTERVNNVLLSPPPVSSQHVRFDGNGSSTTTPHTHGMLMQTMSSQVDDNVPQTTTVLGQNASSVNGGNSNRSTRTQVSATDSVALNAV